MCVCMYVFVCVCMHTHDSDRGEKSLLKLQKLQLTFSLLVAMLIASSMSQANSSAPPMENSNPSANLEERVFLLFAPYSHSWIQVHIS